MKKLTLAHLYPNEMNIYGDRGNVLALSRRLQWRGYQLEVVNVEPASQFDLRKADMIFGGGGQDKGQTMIAADLQSRKSQLHEAVEAGVPLLAICGTYQLLGHGFITASGTEIAGVSIFRATTKASSQRMIGNIIVESDFGSLVGFENHSGQTILEEGQQPLGNVTVGFGNNADTNDEGAVNHNAYGSYLHGPLLPKNPQLADELILRGLKHRFGKTRIRALNDTLEHQAAKFARARAR